MRILVIPIILLCACSDKAALQQKDKEIAELRAKVATLEAQTLKQASSTPAQPPEETHSTLSPDLQALLSVLSRKLPKEEAANQLLLILQSIGSQADMLENYFGRQVADVHGKPTDPIRTIKDTERILDRLKSNPLQRVHAARTMGALGTAAYDHVGTQAAEVMNAEKPAAAPKPPPK